MFEKKVLHIYCIITGFLFLISGAGKIIDTTAFSNLIDQYGLGYLMLLSPVIVVAEIFIGMSLILLIRPRLFSMLAFILLMIFTLAFAYGYFIHGINDCGCFGTLKHTNMSPGFTFLRNLILMIMCLFVFLKYPKEEETTGNWKKTLINLVIYPALFIAGLSFTIPAFLKPAAAKHPFQDQHIKNTALTKYIKTSPDSTYLIFFFTYTCPHCWNSIENLKQYKITKTVDSVMTFASGEASDKISFMYNFQPDFSIVDLPLKTISQFTDIFPTAFYIEHDTIKTIIQSVLPSPVTFKKQNETAN
jgi:uncharacterized membrane protein YphA (DoxX/SURF4 family)